MEFPPDPSGPLLGSAEGEVTLDVKLRTAFKKTKHQHKWLVSHLKFSDRLDALCYEFTLGEAREGCGRSY